MLDYFRSKCDRFVCIECLITEHPHFQHGVSKVSDVIPRYKGFLGMSKTETEYTAPELLRATGTFQGNALKSERKLDDFKDKIRERKEEILREVISVTVASFPIQGSPFTANAVISENDNVRDEPLHIVSQEKSGCLIRLR